MSVQVEPGRLDLLIRACIAQAAPELHAFGFDAVIAEILKRCGVPDKPIRAIGIGKVEIPLPVLEWGFRSLKLLPAPGVKRVRA